MASFATWAALLLLLPAALAGCVKPEPTETPPPGCDPAYCMIDCTFDCCHDCWDPPVVTPACFCEREILCDCACAGPCTVTYVPEPTLRPFDARLLSDDCAGCQGAAVAIDARGRALVATALGLFIANAAHTTLLEAPADDVTFASVHAAEGGAAWYVALSRPADALPALVVAELAPDDAWGRILRIDAAREPALLAAERAWAFPIDGSPYAILADDRQAWGVAWLDAEIGFANAQPLTPLGGRAAVGEPVLDEKGNLLVPFAFTPEEAGRVALVAPAAVAPSLHYALVRSHASPPQASSGFAAPHGVAPATAPALDLHLDGVSYTYTDASGTARRITSWDAGSSWGGPVRWSEPSADVHGSPAARRAATEATLAWWQEGGDGVRLVVARGGADGEPLATASVATKERPDDEALPVGPAPSPERAALALDLRARAVVAWSVGDEAWLAFEEGALAPPTSCFDNAHCWGAM